MGKCLFNGFYLRSSLRLGSSGVASSGSFLLGLSAPSAVPITAVPAASTAAAAAFFATRLTFDRALEDERIFDFDDVLAFVGLFAFDLTPARLEDDLRYGARNWNFVSS